MAKEVFIATVQIVIHPNEDVDSEGGACDWFSGLLSENSGVLDWQYLSIGGQRLSPAKKLIPDYVQEGNIF